MPVLKLKIPPPHRGQRRVRKGQRRFNVLCCGRRWGKTAFMLDQAIAQPGGVLDRLPVAWFAPTYKMLLEPWREALKILEPAIVETNVQERRIEIVGGGSLTFWSLQDPDGPRGRKYALALIDEAAKVRKLRDTWTRTIRPTLTDYRGGAWFSSSPLGRNDFYELFHDAAQPDKARLWARFREPTLGNPFILPEEIEDARADMTELDFAQEYLAKFVDFGGTSIKRDWIEYGDPSDDGWGESDLVTVAGVDLAISKKTTADWTAVVILSMSPDKRIYIRHAERRRLAFHEILAFVRSIASPERDWSLSSILIEDVAFQIAVVQELIRETKLPVRPYSPQRAETGVARKDKVARFGIIETRFSQDIFRLSETVPDSFVSELLSFPNGEHDDYCDALVAAFSALHPVTARRYAVADPRAIQ
jgi:predicted phage terminase large subunit-like protein